MLKNWTLRELLNEIDEFLWQDIPRARGLWDILTALRGPDDEDLQDLKLATTGVVRTLAFPKTSTRHCETGGPLKAAFAYNSPIRLGELAGERKEMALPTYYYSSDHFRTHVARALSALEREGFNVDGTNPISKS